MKPGAIVSLDNNDYQVVNIRKKGKVVVLKLIGPTNIEPPIQPPEDASAATDG